MNFDLVKLTNIVIIPIFNYKILFDFSGGNMYSTGYDLTRK